MHEKGREEAGAWCGSVLSCLTWQSLTLGTSRPCGVCIASDRLCDALCVTACTKAAEAQARAREWGAATRQASPGTAPPRRRPKHKQEGVSGVQLHVKPVQGALLRAVPWSSAPCPGPRALDHVAICLHAARRVHYSAHPHLHGPAKHHTPRQHTSLYATAQRVPARRGVTRHNAARCGAVGWVGVRG